MRMQTAAKLSFFPQAAIRQNAVRIEMRAGSDPVAVVRQDAVRVEIRCCNNSVGAEQEDRAERSLSVSMGTFLSSRKRDTPFAMRARKAVQILLRLGPSSIANRRKLSRPRETKFHVSASSARPYASPIQSSPLHPVLRLLSHVNISRVRVAAPNSKYQRATPCESLRPALCSHQFCALCLACAGSCSSWQSSECR